MGGAYGRGTIFPRPGEGTLKDVQLVQGDPRYLTLEVDHLGNKFSGALFATDPQDPDVTYRLYMALRNCLNRDLQDVGYVEIDL
jgi:hypothetical protein